MLDGPVEAEKVYVHRSQREILKKATDDHVAGIAQGNDDFRVGEHSQPQGQRGGGCRIFVNQNFGGGRALHLAKQASEVTIVEFHALGGGKIVQGRRGQWRKWVSRKETIADLHHEGVGLVKRGDGWMRAKDLFQKGGPATRMAAQQGQFFGGVWNRGVDAPAAEHFRVQLSQQRSPPARGLLKSLFQRRDIVLLTR